MYNCLTFILSCLGFDDFFSVQSELSPVATKWKSIGAALRLKSDVLENIAASNGDPHACMSEMVIEWLKKNYDVRKYGEPTWQRLVEVVVHPSGGANSALARNMARKHKARGM